MMELARYVTQETSTHYLAMAIPVPGTTASKPFCVAQGFSPDGTGMRRRAETICTIPDNAGTRVECNVHQT